MKIKITAEDRRACIEIKGDDLSVDEVNRLLIEPALVAMGYHPSCVRAALGDRDNGVLEPDCQ